MHGVLILTPLLLPVPSPAVELNWLLLTVLTATICLAGGMCAQLVPLRLLQFQALPLAAAVLSWRDRAAFFRCVPSVPSSSCSSVGWQSHVKGVGARRCITLTRLVSG
jgi:hypothetical protein